MTEICSYLDGEWEHYISIEFRIELFNKKGTKI